MNYFTRRADWSGRVSSALTVLALALSLIQPLTILGLPLTAQAVTPTTIFSDSFLSGSEGNEFPNWTFANAKWDRESGGRTDSKKAAIEDDTGSVDDVLVKATSTAGFSSVALSYWYKINHDLGPNDHVYVEWSNNNGSTWNTVADHKNISAGAWVQNSINLTGADNQSGFQFRFRAHLIDNGFGDHDDFWLDDVLLTGFPTPTGSISGQKWNDLNGDGGKGDEPGLAGWTINLIKDSQVASTTITDNGGNYLFKGLENGSYKVCEVNQDLWKRTSPTTEDGCHDVTISGGAPVTGKDFGNTQQGRIILNKVTNPEDADDDFSFTGTAVDAVGQSPIVLTGTASTSLDVAPGSYTLTEGDMIGWDLKDITCDSESANGNLETKTATINLSAGQITTCTFTNWQRASLMLDNVATPNEDTFSFQLTGPESYEQVKTTIGSGRATFEDLISGDYSLKILTELLASSWSAGTPTACWNDEGTELSPASLTINPGDEIYCVFTNNKEGFVSAGDEEQGLIMGRKFNDNDRDGKRDKGEKGLKDWTINLYQKVDDPQTSEWTWPLIKSYQTLKSGRYMFSNLDPGLYHVCEVQQQGWTQSPVFNPEICVEENTDGQRLEVRPGEAKLGINFGNWHNGAIAGIKWNDKDGDGKRDAGEEKLSGWTIQLYSGDGLTKLAETSTDGSGRYTFSDLIPDTYVVREVNQPGWSPTSPVGGEQTVVVLSNQTKKRVNFGNFHDTIAPTLSIGLGNGNTPDNTGPEHGQTYSGLINVFATLEDASPNSFHFRVVKDGGNMGNSCGSTLGDPENQGYNKCGYPFNLREATTTSFTNARITTLDAAQLAAVAGYGDYWLIIGADDTAGNRTNPDWTLDPRVKITISEAPAGDREAPVTVITSPNPDTEWEGTILITGTTTDNVATASTTLSYAIYNGETCDSTYTPIITLANPDLDAVFDWTYNWSPAEEGIYCIQANGTDTSGNEEHTYIVPRIKFKKIAQTNPEEPGTPTGGGVTGSSGGGPSIFGRTTGTTTIPTGQGGSETGEQTNPVTQLLAGAGLGNVGGGASTTDLVGDDSTSTPTSTKISATSSPLLAALGNLGGWWWWILLLILIAAGLGYWYWNKKENN